MSKTPANPSQSCCSIYNALSALGSRICKTPVKPLRSACPIHSALSELGDRWTLLIIRELLMLHSATYSELLGMSEKISTNILADRLAKLQQVEIIGKNDSDNRFWLTDKGIELAPVLLELATWSAKHNDTTSLSAEATQLYTRLHEDRDGFLTELKHNVALARES